MALSIFFGLLTVEWYNEASVIKHERVYTMFVADVLPSGPVAWI